MITKPMIPGCSSSSLTWSSWWGSSRYPACASLLAIITACIDFSASFFHPAAFSPGRPLSRHLWHTDQFDDQPDIDRNGEDCSEVLIQQGGEPHSAIGWQHYSHHFTSHHWHLWGGGKASSNDLLISPERPAGADGLHASTILFLGLHFYRRPPNEFLQHAVHSLFLSCVC